MEIGQDGSATGELLESWETKPGATDWVFNVRKGVTFHSGKTLDADDIIYSLNLHRGETKSPAKDLLSAITDIKKLSPTQVGITLSSGNADLPYNLSDYHVLRGAQRVHRTGRSPTARAPTRWRVSSPA